MNDLKNKFKEYVKEHKNDIVDSGITLSVLWLSYIIGYNNAKKKLTSSSTIKSTATKDGVIIETLMIKTIK